MTYAIIGAGAVGQALAVMFARKGIDATLASTRPPEAIAPLAKAIGPTITPVSLEEAAQADVVLLAVPFWAHRDVAKAATDWRGKTVIDATNAYGVPLADLDNLPSSAVIAKAFDGAALVKAFNHLPARTLAEDPQVGRARRVTFLAGDDEAAIPAVAALVERLGFAPVSLGGLGEGGRLIQARGNNWSPLTFQDLFKQEA